jgi:hypothetical protein
MYQQPMRPRNAPSSSFVRCAPRFHEISPTSRPRPLVWDEQRTNMTVLNPKVKELVLITDLGLKIFLIGSTIDELP